MRQVLDATEIADEASEKTEVYDGEHWLQHKVPGQAKALPVHDHGPGEQESVHYCGRQSSVEKRLLSVEGVFQPVGGFIIVLVGFVVVTSEIQTHTVRFVQAVLFGLFHVFLALRKFVFIISIPRFGLL